MTDQSLISLNEAQKQQLLNHIQSNQFAAGYRYILSLLPTNGNAALASTRY